MTTTPLPCPATRDRNGLGVLSRDEALALLATRTIGRVAVTLRALPVILPVSYVYDPETEKIVFRTGHGTKLDAAVRNAVVAFQVDAFDETDRSGWSVLVVGTASPITNLVEIGRICRLGLDPWVPRSRDGHVIAVAAVHVSGRVLDRMTVAAPFPVALPHD